MAKRRTFNDPGHAHELTFSTYRRTRLLEEHAVCRLFLAKLDAARHAHRFEVWAYVLMPDHVHLLVWPTERVYSVEDFRRTLKFGVAREALAAGGRNKGDLSLGGMGETDRTLTTSVQNFASVCAHVARDTHDNAIHDKSFGQGRKRSP